MFRGALADAKAAERIRPAAESMRVSDGVNEAAFAMTSAKEGAAAASLERLIEHAEERIRSYVEQIRNGSFPVQPNGNTVCQTCNYRVMCRIQSLRVSEDEQDRDD